MAPAAGIEGTLSAFRAQQALVVEADFTLVGVNPALDEFTEIAKDLRLAADDRATEHGRTLVERVKAGATKR